ncbi:MAG: choice-of-anchor J domain-containing protein [[Clostridium] fimetarium]|nr:choice-of-anchor J domain-containing protein [Alistipes timonensis]MCM1405048.1 choice-of-anchor J domain-containing protein [[Clostridium] fimetarium]
MTPARRTARIASLTKASAGNLPEIQGVVVYADNWGYTPQTGLYKLPTADGMSFEKLVDGPNGSSVVRDDRVYTINRVSVPEFEIDYPRYTIYDLESGAEIYYKNYWGETDWSICPADMDIDPTTGEVYAVTFNRDMTGYQLSKLAFTDEEVTSTLVAGLNGNWNSIAFDGSGQLYGISKTNVVVDGYWVCSSSTLNKIDKTTGSVTPVGETGLCPEFLSSAAIDHKTGRMYWTVSPADETGLLAEVDLATGEATILRTFEHAEEVVGLYVPAPAAASGAPAKVEGLAASFPNGSLSGKVSFTAPTTLYDRTPATGNLSYEVTANGTTVATGTTAYGALVEADVTLASAGQYTLRASVSNASGKGPEAKTTLYVGNGIPAAPYVSLAMRSGAMLLTWSDVEETTDGGYINPAEVSYTIKRYPDDVVVATGHKTTSFSETLPQPETFTSYYYGVTADYAGNSSAEAYSNRITMGEIVPPYIETFDEESSIDGWTIIDANSDRRLWMWSTLQNLRISFNQAKPMDDWAITPAIRLTAGRIYRLSFDVYCDDPNTAERIEVKMGASNTAAAMVTTIVGPTEVKTTADAPLTVTANITPDETGVYFIGFHCISDADSYMLNFDNLKIESGLDAGAPAAATDLTATADPTGAYKATISFTTPAKTIAGGLMWQTFKKVEVSRDGTVVKTFTSAEPNQQLSFTDTPDKAGRYTYTVCCHNMFGQGMPASVTVYIGTGEPSKPASATIAETANEGEVTVGWSPVTTDKNGNPVPAEKISYTIAEYTIQGWTPKFEGLTGTSHTFRATEGAQDMVQYAVFAETEGGISEGTPTDLIPVGPAYRGLAESFANASATTLWGTRVIQNGTFMTFDDESGIPSQDGDNGFMGMRGESYNDRGALFSGKISLKGFDNPGLTFHTFNIANDNVNEITIGVKEAGAAEYTTLKTIAVKDASQPDEWGKVSVALDAYAGKTIQIQFLCTIKAYPFILIDNIAVGSLIANDLTIDAISAPATVTTGTGYAVAVTVANEGTANADGYTVDLFANGIKADSKQCGPLAAGQKNTVEFEREMHALENKAVEYYAVVNYSADEIPGNNTSGFAKVTPKESTLPRPENLAVATNGSGMTLSWNAPDLSKAVAEEMTEDFEDARAFATEVDGWIFTDADNAPLGGFESLDGTPINIPGLTPNSTTGSFIVFDSSACQLGAEAFSGTKFIGAIFRADDGLTDDWAISPELDGGRQTISFFARSLSGSYPEKVQVLYSEGGTDTGSFTPLCDLTTVPSDWARLSIDLPEGAKRFAIRSSSTGSFLLMLDDITFTPAASTLNLSLAGYNVYRDGEKQNLSPVSAPSYTDADGNADHKYVVTAVYDGKGESGASNEASLNSGIDATTSAKVEITTADGHIIISGAGSSAVTVGTIDGITLHSGRGDAKIAVAPGVYVVKAGRIIEKIAVR